MGTTCFFQTQVVSFMLAASLRHDCKVSLRLLHLFDIRAETTGYQVEWLVRSCDHRPRPHAARPHSRQPGNKGFWIKFEPDKVESPVTSTSTSTIASARVCAPCTDPDPASLPHTDPPAFPVLSPGLQTSQTTWLRVPYSSESDLTSALHCKGSPPSEWC